MKLYELFAAKGFHTCIASTFGIDFEAYETVVLPRLRGAGCRNNMVVADVRMLTQALAGASQLPRWAGIYYTISGATAAGVFHPKLFLQIGRKRGRLIVASANLTTPGLAGNLEILDVVECDEKPSGDQDIVAEAWSYLGGHLADDRATVHQVGMARRGARWLPEVGQSGTPKTLGDGSLAAFLSTGEDTGIGRRFCDLVDGPVRRLVVVSPYWDGGLKALGYLTERLSPRETLLVVDKANVQFPKQALSKLGGVRLVDRGDFEKGRFIHAKLILAETGDADHVLSGSANCTIDALGTAEFKGRNAEASLYRRVQPGSTAEALKLEALFAAPSLRADELADPVMEDEIPLEALASLNAGSFEFVGDTLVWSAPAAAIDVKEIELLDVAAQPLGRIVVLPDTRRFRLAGLAEPPRLARAIRADGSVSAPSVVVILAQLERHVRDATSRKREGAIVALQDDNEATMQLLAAMDLLEEDEREEGAQPMSIPKPKETGSKSEKTPKILRYEDFIKTKRPPIQNAQPYSGLGGSDVSLVNVALNRILGRQPEATTPAPEDDEGDDFGLGDETSDAEAALRAGEELGAKKKKMPEKTEAERKAERLANARSQSKSQILEGEKRFRDLVDARRKSDLLGMRDIVRLRAFLMVVCTAAIPSGPNSVAAEKSRYQVLRTDGSEDGWPKVLGRTLFVMFGGADPAIAHVSFSGEDQHDQVPDELIEGWATVFWCVQACLSAPLLKADSERLGRALRGIAERAYGMWGALDVAIGEPVVTVMDHLSARYCNRMGLSADSIKKGHERTARDVSGGHRPGSPASQANSRKP